MRKREKIYIIPTEFGFMYGAGIFVSLVGGALYNNNLAFILCFFLVALFLIGMVKTHSNLQRMELEKINIFLSPSGGTGHGVIWIKSHNSEGHSQIHVECKDNDDKILFTIPEIYKKSLYPHYFNFEAGDWGKKNLKKIRIFTRYPFGFFYVWRNFPVHSEYFIFPQPKGDLSLQDNLPRGQDEGLSRELNGEDFSEHKKYEFGDSNKHIDWKAYARGRPLLTKRFEDGQKKTFLIDIHKAHGNLNQKAMQVSKWVQECEKGDHSYALRLSNRQLPVGYGEAHRVECLKALASEREVS